MSAITVTRALVSNTNPTEAQFDTMRNDLLTFFNNPNLDATNIADGGMLLTSLVKDLGDDVTLKWTSNHTTFQFISGTEKFEVKNTEGDFVWGTLISGTIDEHMSFRKDDAAVSVGGKPQFNTDKMNANATTDLLWLLARYRKPKLVYQDANVFTIEANSNNSSETMILMPGVTAKVIDATCSLAVNANGEDAGDLGAAVSGLGHGLTRATNTWYYVYAVVVQYGDNADGESAILIAHTTSPLAANIAALNTAFGTGKWTYMGLIRNGYNDGTNTNIIVPFIYDESGYLRFTQGTLDNQGMGITLASANNTDVNLVYAMAFGNGAAQIPPTATRAIFGGYRESYGFELAYEANATGELHQITTGCEHTSDLSTLVPCLHLEVPTLTGYNVKVIVGDSITDKRITLVGVLDHYL